MEEATELDVLNILNCIGSEKKASLKSDFLLHGITVLFKCQEIML